MPDRGPYWSSLISSDFVVLLLRNLSFLAASTSFMSIAMKFNGPLEAAQAHNDDVRYDIIECWSAGLHKAQGPYWYSQISHDVVESFLRKLSF